MDLCLEYFLGVQDGGHARAKMVMMNLRQWRRPHERMIAGDLVPMWEGAFQPSNLALECHVRPAHLPAFQLATHSGYDDDGVQNT